VKFHFLNFNVDITMKKYTSFCINNKQTVVDPHNRLDGLLQEMNTTLGSPMSDKAPLEGSSVCLLFFWATKEERKTMG
jgi:hypothetical protein